MWDALYKIGYDNATFIFTASQPFTSALVMSNVKEFKHEWIWKKNRGSNFMNTMREPMKEHESVLVFSKGKWIYNKQMEERAENGLARAKYSLNYLSKSSNYRDFEGRSNQNISEMRVPSSVQSFKCEVGYHPTQKPIPLLEYIIRTYTNEGDTILDFTMGSGSTGVAAMNTRRNFIGIEKEESYFKIAQERIAEAQSFQLLNA